MEIDLPPDTVIETSPDGKITRLILPPFTVISGSGGALGSEMYLDPGTELVLQKGCSIINLTIKERTALDSRAPNLS